MSTVEHQLPRYANQPLARTGGPRPSRSTRVEREENTRMTVILGTHMPLDTEPHWTWRNPLNLLPALMIVLMLVAIVGTALTLV